MPRACAQSFFVLFVCFVFPSSSRRFRVRMLLQEYRPAPDTAVGFGTRAMYHVLRVGLAWKSG